MIAATLLFLPALPAAPQDLVASAPAQVRHVRYHVPSGRLAPAGPWSPPGNLALSSATFANAAVVGGFAPTGGDEWQAWGTKDTAGLGPDGGPATGPVCEVDVAYGTTVCDDPPGSGLVELEVAFFTGTTGACAPGTELRRVRLVGLPGDPDCADGVPATVVVTVELGPNELLYLPDGPIGWSYAEVGTIGETGPLLVAPSLGPGSCAPPGLPSPGTSDCFDVHAPGPDGIGPCLQTTSLATPGTSSFFLVLREEVGGPSAVTPRFGTPPNPGAMASVTPPVIGATWTTQVTVPAVPVPALDVLAVSKRPSNPPTGIVLGPSLTALIDLVPPSPFLIQLGPVPLDQVHVFVPVTCNLVGATFSAQMVQVDVVTGDLGGTNALDLVIGTP